MDYFVRGFPMLRKLMRMFSDVPGASRRTARVETERAIVCAMWDLSESHSKKQFKNISDRIFNVTTWIL